MKKIAAALAAGLALGSASAAELSEEQKTFYALGQVLARNVSTFSLTRAELDAVQQGFRDGVLGAKSAVDMNVYGPKIQPLATARQAAVAEKSAAAGKAQLAKAAQEKGAQKAQRGLVYLALREGKGAKPAATDTVRVHYRGTLIDGTEFDSSYKRKEPTEFPLNGVIPCWTEGVQMMKVGGKARLTCPPETAYGERGAGGVIPPNATLTFEVELLEIKQAAK
ncbi:MAG TPA: FKBP-type peptidyl-prolyl cis-trans isomerase [Burkholderiales bacterium]|nr:FKBP-type peptidyl-prolyl cis-trans isomerase [Burkholderiales bacterium]